MCLYLSLREGNTYRKIQTSNKNNAKRRVGIFMRHSSFISFPLRNPIVTKKYPFPLSLREKCKVELGVFGGKNKWLSQSRLRSWMLVRDRERADKVAE